MDQLKIIPFYTGVKTIKEVLKDKKSLSLLWLEILLNDTIDWEKYLSVKEIKSAYEKACVWYSNFKTLIQVYTQRQPLNIKKGTIDEREYWKFLEVLNFVSD